jgi:uncharacterized protein YbjT (DUF2867 family)
VPTVLTTIGAKGSRRLFVATWSRATRRRLAMFVVLGASGNTGKVVAETLLRQKKKVRVVLHDAAKGKAWSEAGADVAIADVDEGAALERAFSGAKGVDVLLPPNFSSSHVPVDNNRRTHTIAAAVKAAGVPHVVLLSSIGAQQSDGTGPVLGLRDAEAVFSRANAAATFVRAAYFMENWVGRCTLSRWASYRHSFSWTR